MDMVRQPDYQRAVRHRNAAVADSRLICCREAEAGKTFLAGQHSCAINRFFVDAHSSNRRFSTMGSERIDQRFAQLGHEGRAALVTFITAGDPDLETVVRHSGGCPERARISSSWACRSPIPWPMALRSRWPGAAPCHAGQTMVKTLEMVRAFREQPMRHPDRADGLLQPDLFLRSGRVHRRRAGGRRRWV
jgi:hypothetical protein